MTVIQMSEWELTRLRVLIDLSDRRLPVEAAARLMGLGRRQVYRLGRAFAADGPERLGVTQVWSPEQSPPRWDIPLNRFDAGT